MKSRIGLLLLLTGFLSTNAWCVNFGDNKNGVDWHFSPAINGGYNHLISGYEGYEDLGNIGLDLYIRPGRDTKYPEQWFDNLITRLSVDYFPLQVPKGVYGLTEDIVGLNVSVLYQFHRLQLGRRQKWVPFFGLGGGYYQDRIVLDTPASGKITSNKNFPGYVGSLGLMMPVFNMHWPFRFIPEIRYHHLEVVDGHATNMTYQLGFSLWFGEDGD